MNGVQQLVDKLMAVDPKAVSRFRGASVQQIRRLEELSGIAIKGVYLRFLQHMGVDDGRLISSGPLDMRIDTVVRHYMEVQDALEDPPPEGQLVIARGSGGIDEITIAVAEGVADDGPLSVASGSEIRREYGDSLLKFLWQHTVRYENRRLPGMLVCYADNTENHAIWNYKFPDKLGIQKEWYSDSYHYYGKGKDSMITISHQPHLKDAVIVATRDRGTAEDILRAMNPRFPISIEEWRTFPTHLRVI